MKRILLVATALVLVVTIFTLCGCETSISLDNTTESSTVSTTKKVPETAVVEITSPEGIVLSTETVTMSKQDKEEEKNFFKPIIESSVSTQVSQDRLQQAIQNQQMQNQVTAPDINNTDPEEGDGNTSSKPSAPDVPYVQDDAAVLRSSQYMINIRLVDAAGVAQNYKVAKNGKNSSVSMIYNEVPMAVILGEKTWYLVSPEDKTYIVIPKEAIEEQATEDEFAQLILGDPFNFNQKVVSKSTVKEDGVTYNVVEYDNGNADYFVGNTIIKTTSTDNSVVYYDSVSPIAPMSLFSPPADYKETKINESNVNDIVQTLEPTVSE